MSSRPPGPLKPKDVVVRDFSGGMNLATQREAIKDNEVWWLEGLMPIAPGNLQPVAGLGNSSASWASAMSGEISANVFLYSFNVAGTDYFFIVFPASGNGYIGKSDGSAITQPFVGTLTSGKTAAAQWNNQGLLIVDPVGYWDWNISVANTLTALSDSVQSVTITDPGIGWASSPTVTFTGGGGSGATSSGGWIGIGNIGNVVITGAGAGYVVGDEVTIIPSFGGPENMVVKVTTIGGGGTITGISLVSQGKIGVLGANPRNSVGGSGVGATFTVTCILREIVISNRGSGYTSAPAVNITLGGPPTRNATATAVVSGFLGGTAIASYAGRAWIANGRTVTFTDVESYSTFIESGSEFTIQDSYLHANINALFAANNYLYIFGDSSIDVLSNVTVNAAGTASFSRVNVSASVGTTEPRSIFSFNRAIAFANVAGFFLLSGATPENISRGKIDLLVQKILPSANSPIYGAAGTINGNLCAVFTFVFSDAFIGGDTNQLLACYFDGKWFVARQSDGTNVRSPSAICTIPPSIPTNTRYHQIFGLMSDITVRQLFAPGFATTRTRWRLRTKLYDFGTPMIGKQAVRAAMGVTMGNTVASRAGIVFTVDTEVHSPGQVTALPAGTFNGYKFFAGSNNEGASVGSTYMGWGIDATTSGTQADVTQLRWLGIQFNEVAPWPV